MSTSILDKISKVLAQAERTENEHEADAFLAQAQRMATTHSIDLTLARQHTAKIEKRETPIQRTIQIGTKGAVGNAKLVRLFLNIAGHNDVTCNIAYNSTYVIAFGFPSDIEVVEALYAHLSWQMVEGANKYLRSGAHKDEAVWNPRTRTYTAPNGRTARLSFYDGFTRRIDIRLFEAKREAESEAEDIEVTDPEGRATSAALVLADKKAEVASFYKQKSTARGSWRGGSRRGSMSSDRARSAGDDAGTRARMSAMPTLPSGAKAAVE